MDEMTRLLAMAVALLVLAAGCGGNSDEDAADGTDGAAPTQTAGGGSDSGSSSTSTSDAADGGASSEASGPSTATVTLGDQTYQFSTEGARIAQCQTDLFGVFSVQLPMIDGGGSIKLLILHDDTDPSVVEEVNAVSVAIGDQDWLADEASELFDMSDKLEAGMSQVDSAEIDGSTVRGTATFVRELSLFTGEVETATGTFEATCGEERIS